jgi:hypothetical protein
MLKDDDWDTRFWAAYALARIDKNPRAVLGVMVESSAKEDPTIRRAAWEVVLQLKPPVRVVHPGRQTWALVGPTGVKEGLRGLV